MKIALLTYFHALSYGATLQTYATIKALESLGHEVWLINLYIPETSSLPKRLLLLPKEYKHWKFRKKYFKHITRHYTSSEDLRNDPPEADLYMIGSDQTWNPDISEDKASSFFLDFVKDNSKKVTYAASFGKDTLDGTKWISKERIIELLRQFRSIAIRETSGKELLSKFGIDSIQVVDPVLLFAQYDELVGKPQQREEIGLFKINKTNEFYAKAKEVGNLASIPVRSIGSLRREPGVICRYPEGIEGWMRATASSRYILTDSFHGLVISLLYHRQFVILPGMRGRVTRLRSLLQLVGLEDRIISTDDSAESIFAKLQQPINYDHVDVILSKEREKSWDYLKSLGSN
jgi:hypothetical protein